MMATTNWRLWKRSSWREHLGFDWIRDRWMYFYRTSVPAWKKRALLLNIYIYIWYKSQIYKKYIWMIYVKCISWPTGKKFYNWIYWPVYLWIHTPNWSTVSDRGHQPPGGGADLRHTSEVVGFRVVGGKSTTVAAFCGGFPLAIREMSEVVPQDFFCFGKKFFFFDKWGEKNTFFSYTLRPWFFFKYPFFWVVFPP